MTFPVNKRGENRIMGARKMGRFGKGEIFLNMMDKVDGRYC